MLGGLTIHRAEVILELAEHRRARSENDAIGLFDQSGHSAEVIESQHDVYKLGRTSPYLDNDELFFMLCVDFPMYKILPCFHSPR